LTNHSSATEREIAEE